MKLKLDANGNVVVVDGKPVYVKDDGSDIAFDAVGTLATITRLNGEAKDNRIKSETAEAALAKFTGISDPAAALAALDTVSKLDQKKLIDAGEVDKVRAEVSKVYDAKLADATTRLQAAETSLFTEKVGGAFSRSKYITEKMAIPADLVEARFGKHFVLEEGKVIAKDSAGNKIYSPTNPGELANFDEAIGVLVDAYPNKDHILKGSGAQGSGASTSVAASGGKKTITRSQFDGMDAQSKAATITAGTVVSD
jgi:hypothetical protein